jgi:hypothetical protein
VLSGPIAEECVSLGDLAWRLAPPEVSRMTDILSRIVTTNIDVSRRESDKGGVRPNRFFFPGEVIAISQRR